MKTHRIAVIAGDGIGKEVMPEGLRALEAAARRFDIPLAITGASRASAARFLAEPTAWLQGCSYQGDSRSSNSRDHLGRFQLAAHHADEPLRLQ